MRLQRAMQVLGDTVSASNEYLLIFVRLKRVAVSWWLRSKYEESNLFQVLQGLVNLLRADVGARFQSFDMSAL